MAQSLHGAYLDSQIGCELLRHALSDIERAEAPQVGVARQEQNTVDEQVGVLLDPEGLVKGYECSPSPARPGMPATRQAR